VKDRLCEQIFQICHEKEKNDFFSMNIIFLKSSWHMLKAGVSMGCHRRWIKYFNCNLEKKTQIVVTLQASSATYH